MAAKEIISYIGLILKNSNSFDSYAVNGIQLKDGRVIEFTDQTEKDYIGIRDNVGDSFYIRASSPVNFTQERKLTSLQKDISSATSNCRLVAFSFRDTDSEWLMNKLITDLKRIDFSPVLSNRPTITIKKSNANYIDNFNEECKKQNFDPGSPFACISIDFDVKYTVAECEDCFTPAPSFKAIIEDQDGNIIKQLNPREIYTVLSFSGIDGGEPGTVYTNSIVGGTP